MTTMGKFYPWILRHSPIVRAYHSTVGYRRLTADYEAFINHLDKHNAPQNVRDECALAKEVYDRPAPPKMTKEHKEETLIHCLALFGDPPPDFKDERLPVFVRDGYRYYVRRSFLPAGGGVRVSERDVEYRIQATNSEFTKTKKEHHGWSCWVYINRPGYLCDGRYPSLPNTDYGVQWGRGFN